MTSSIQKVVVLVRDVITQLLRFSALHIALNVSKIFIPNSALFRWTKESAVGYSPKNSRHMIFTNFKL